MIPQDAIATALVDYFQTLAHTQGPLHTETDLLASGLLDSLQVIDLVCFLESRFRVRMQPADINAGNLGSVNRIAQYILSQAA